MLVASANQATLWKKLMWAKYVTGPWCVQRQHAQVTSFCITQLTNQTGAAASAVAVKLGRGLLKHMSYWCYTRVGDWEVSLYSVCYRHIWLVNICLYSVI